MKMSKYSTFFKLKQQIQKYFKLILLVGAILLFFTTPARNLLDREILSDSLQKLGIWAVPAFISTYVLVAVLGLPITVHTLAGGFVFGLAWGTVWSTLSATLGAVGAFYLTRYVFQDWAIANFGRHKLLAKFNRAFASIDESPNRSTATDREDRNSFNLILALRLAPIAPFNLINFLLALTPINLKIYTFATFIGVIPGTIAYTWLGSAGKTALQDGDRLQFGFAAIFLVFLSLLPLWLKRWRF
jgi:uncharacterized membrane protein YdjX (TVP38/TMEM64 family)